MAYTRKMARRSRSASRFASKSTTTERSILRGLEDGQEMDLSHVHGALKKRLHGLHVHDGAKAGNVQAEVHILTEAGDAPEALLKAIGKGKKDGKGVFILKKGDGRPRRGRPVVRQHRRRPSSRVVESDVGSRGK